MRHPFGWDLPPGVSQRDIDREFGDDEEPKACKDCGESDCVCPDPDDQLNERTQHNDKH